MDNKVLTQMTQKKAVVFPLILLLAALLWATGCAADEASAGSHVALVGESQGSVEWREPDGNEWQPLNGEQELAQGHAIRTAADSHVWLTFPDGSKTLLGPDTELTIVELHVDENEDRRLIRLEQVRGESRHIVLQQDVAQNVYEVRTPAGVSSTAEGAFAVSAHDEAETRVAVTSGLVRCDSGGEAYPVTAGKMVSLRAGETPQAAAFLVYGQGQVTEMGQVWVISGRPFVVDNGAIVSGDVTLGDRVYVEGHVQEDGTLVADLITLDHTRPALVVPREQDDDLIFVSSDDDAGECVTHTGTVTRLEDNAAILHDGTVVNLSEAADVDGEVALYSVIMVTTCFDDEGGETVRVVVLEEAGDPIDEDTQQVTVCHVPPGNPANAHTITIGRPAVDAHLAHGDFLGPCDEAWEKDDWDDEWDEDVDDAASGQVTICHRPPGNPANAHTITVGEPAVDAHLAHGDTLGPCGNGNGGPGNK
ncbi:MAG TPA: FecR domain-containing protein [Candidatus Sulfomarinibacteraceae bacterium]|nr:FecR domain-containing protein [Candidatus Sulfomarinibacteraceae bacterium]